MVLLIFFNMVLGANLLWRTKKLGLGNDVGKHGSVIA
jgi:hypothetical protein